MQLARRRVGPELVAASTSAYNVHISGASKSSQHRSYICAHNATETVSHHNDLQVLLLRSERPRVKSSIEWNEPFQSSPCDSTAGQGDRQKNCRFYSLHFLPKNVRYLHRSRRLEFALVATPSPEGLLARSNYFWSRSSHDCHANHG